VGLLIDEELEGVKSAKLHSVQPRQSVRPAPIVQLGVDQEAQEVNGAHGNIGRQYFLEGQLNDVSIDVDG
jgi:hypothetical protein